MSVESVPDERGDGMPAIRREFGTQRRELRCPPGTAEAIARRFHERYEELAPRFGYMTREASARPWSEVPNENRRLMIATVMALLGDRMIEPGDGCREALSRSVNELEQ